MKLSKGSSSEHLKETSSSQSSSNSSSSLTLDRDDDQSPPLSPLRLPSSQKSLSSSNSSISSWKSSHQLLGSQSSDDGDSNHSIGSAVSCNSKDDRSTYNTKFARYHLETYRQNDRMRWNFDFDHNRPLDDSHHHHHQTVPRYQWEPAI